MKRMKKKELKKKTEKHTRVNFILATSSHTFWYTSKYNDPRIATGQALKESSNFLEIERC